MTIILRRNNPEIELDSNSPKVSHFIWIVIAVGLAVVCLCIGLFLRFKKKDKAELNGLERGRVNQLNRGEFSTELNGESSEPPPPYSRS
jgi:beta-lactamase regulating signal transducer with metallopeptidase domain